MDGYLFLNAKNVAMKTSFYTAFQLKLGIMPIYIFKLSSDLSIISIRLTRTLTSM